MCVNILFIFWVCSGSSDEITYLRRFESRSWAVVGSEDSHNIGTTNQCDDARTTCWHIFSLSYKHCYSVYFEIAE